MTNQWYYWFGFLKNQSSTSSCPQVLSCSQSHSSMSYSQSREDIHHSPSTHCKLNLPFTCHRFILSGGVRNKYWREIMTYFLVFWIVDSTAVEVKHFFCECFREIKQVCACQNAAILNKAACTYIRIMIGLYFSNVNSGFGFSSPSSF